MHLRKRRTEVRLLRLTALLVCSTLLGFARADPASEASVVVPPHLETPAQIAYPTGATGDARVVLILTIEKSGAVRSAEVETGEEPFASAAKQVAGTWHFEPATRAHRPVATRIRFVVTFKEPPPAIEASPEAPTLPTQSAPAAPRVVAAKPPIEVVIQADKLPPSVTSLSRAEVRQLPGTFGDPFRAIESLPGVTPILSGLPFFYVRGAPPGNVGYFLDGVRVPYLFHIAAGPSVVNPALVERVDLHSGGYPAQYGRYAGAIVSAETTAPRDDWHGEGTLRIFDAGAMVESGFDHGRGTALVGGRYSYTAALFSILSTDKNLDRIDYRDYQARITYDLTPRDRVSLFAFGSYDLIGGLENGIPTTLFGSEFYRVDARYDHKLGSSGNIRAAVTGGYDQTRVNLVSRNARDVLFATRVELTQPISPSLTVRAGLDAQFDSYGSNNRTFADPDDPMTKRFNALVPVRKDTALAARGDVEWKIDRRVTVTPGIRFDLFRSAGASALAVDGRVALRADVTDRIRLLHAVGIAHQPPSFVLAVPGVATGSLREGLQRSLQSSAGVEVDLREATASVTFFDNVFLNMTDALGSSTPGIDPTVVQPRAMGSGRGMEVYVRRRLTSRLGGFVSYTLSRSTRKVGKASFPSSFDRAHVLNAALAVDLGRGWRAGAKFTFYTGVPAQEEDASGKPSSPGGPVTRRDPAFYRIDARLEKRWAFSGSRWISFVVEMLNTTLNKETLNGEEIGPIAIPSIGLEGGF